MTTAWFTRHLGPVAVELDEQALLVMAPSAVPDYVRLPEELGGRTLRVLGAHIGPCPKCGLDVRHLTLEGPYGVAECPTDTFLWYRERLPDPCRRSEENTSMKFMDFTGHEAIRLAERTGAELRARADPTGAGDREVTLEEARAIAAEDPGLVYVRGTYELMAEMSGEGPTGDWCGRWVIWPGHPTKPEGARRLCGACANRWAEDGGAEPAGCGVGL